MMHIPLHCPWLPGYIDVMQTILVLTMAGLFLDRPPTHTYIHIYIYTCIHTNKCQLMDLFHRRENITAFLLPELQCPVHTQFQPLVCVHVLVVSKSPIICLE